ncbi:unnamed protein product [Blumeria hordei]|uniref:Transcription factor TFIIIC triple barrel domain-containing protein n=1 Tax=Blumeria hordei TaxID=2867405 RepID=A0A383UNL6_BLUHO|nr:unnamed protein product [Blumeria hordei]
MESDILAENNLDQLTQEPFAAACTISLDDTEELEWEYEYSTTETETYYLTIDLTTPDVPPTHPPFDDTVRKKTRWLNPSIGRHRRQTPMPPANRVAKTYTLDGRRSLVENDDLTKGSDVEREIIAETEITNNPTEMKSVQILDLESNLPIVAYDGHVYACNWAENIGTEFIFSPHAEDGFEPLPKLRTLRGNVDLLASSTARLIAKSVKLTPKQTTRHNIAKPRGRDKVLIPVGHAASQQRKDQALFLERIILAKEKRNEMDSVTINAKPRLPPRRLRSLFEERRSQERTELQKKLKQKTVDEADKEMAKERLKEMDREDIEWKSRVDANSKSGRNGGRPKKVPFGPGSRGKIMKSTLWSQRNVKGKSQCGEKKANALLNATLDDVNILREHTADPNDAIGSDDDAENNTAGNIDGESYTISKMMYDDDEDIEEEDDNVLDEDIDGDMTE